MVTAAEINMQRALAKGNRSTDPWAHLVDTMGDLGKGVGTMMTGIFEGRDRRRSTKLWEDFTASLAQFEEPEQMLEGGLRVIGAMKDPKSQQMYAQVLQGMTEARLGKVKRDMLDAQAKAELERTKAETQELNRRGLGHLIESGGKFLKNVGLGGGKAPTDTALRQRAGAAASTILQGMSVEDRDDLDLYAEQALKFANGDERTFTYLMEARVPALSSLEDLDLKAEKSRGDRLNQAANSIIDQVFSTPASGLEEYKSRAMMLIQGPEGGSSGGSRNFVGGPGMPQMRPDDFSLDELREAVFDGIDVRIAQLGENTRKAELIPGSAEAKLRKDTELADMIEKDHILDSLRTRDPQVRAQAALTMLNSLSMMVLDPDVKASLEKKLVAIITGSLDDNEVQKVGGEILMHLSKTASTPELSRRFAEQYKTLKATGQW